MADRNNGQTTETDVEQHRKKELDEILKSEPQFRYMLLSRLQSDCEYYLGYGYRNERKLWAGNARDHIWYMKAIWNSFPEGEKPQWMSMEQIEEYEKEMGVSSGFTAEQEAVIREAEGHGVPNEIMKIITNTDLTAEQMQTLMLESFARYQLDIGDADYDPAVDAADKEERLQAVIHLKETYIAEQDEKEEIEAEK
ncbi:hypothetical protein H8S18_07470 [Christensenella sp. NSJ-35]|uniref:Large polyvalent protein-associated domain-containing protein n=1 Tax=Christensenella tenuis TaxID=2763033 RepID=A0ABR7EGK8_9FIRM|nr:LPD11 domain-containing protein [Christensenella tenuis]MBC5648174.1 hypothetical protein [Christensenella tenuis]